MASTTAPQTPAGASDPTAPGNKGLKPNAIGYISNLVIAIASTAPAYSLAATLGFIVAVGGIGVHAPAVLIVSFIPILFVSVGYRFLNLADPDAGTTFAWVTRAFGPQLGWINGWAIFLADIIVMASLAEIASNYTFLLFNSSAHPSNFSLIIGSVIWIALMTWICYRGIELSARVQTIPPRLRDRHAGAVRGRRADQGLRQQPGALDSGLRVVVQPVRPQLGRAGRRRPARDLHLLGLGLGGGGQRGVAGPQPRAGKAAVVSTVILLLIYVLASVAAQSYHGTSFLSSPPTRMTSSTRSERRVFGSPLNKLMIIAVLTSASASTQTTILPTARTTLSMARWNAIPAAFGRVHPRFLTPSFSTLMMGGLSTVWTVALLAFNPNQDVLGDTISALGFAVCFYYGFTGLACAFYFRRDLFKSVRNFFLAGLIPVVGGIMMGYIAIKAYGYYNTAGNNYSKPLSRHPDADLRRNRRPDPRRRADVRLVAVLPEVLPVAGSRPPTPRSSPTTPLTDTTP